MSKDENNSGKQTNSIPDSSTKTARGSKEIHSKKDNSTEIGFEPNYKTGEEE